MNKQVIYPFQGLTDAQLMNFIFREIDNFRMISQLNDFKEIRRAISTLDPLIVEAKRRNISINGHNLASRILIEE